MTRTIEKRILNLIQERRISDNTSSNYYKIYGYKFDLPFYDDLKESIFTQETQKSEFMLPDQQKMEIPNTEFKFLKKSLLENFTDVLSSVLNKSEEKYRKDFKRNIFLQGGNTLHANLEKNLTISLIEQNENFNDIRIIQRTNDEKRYNSWIGGSLFASLDCFEEMWIRKQEYDEYGIEAVITRNLI